jgi:tRNA1Val (adenine37-N6)-methyltransferase
MERLDDLQHNGLMLYQDTDYERFNADALWLCAFLHAKRADRVVELGSGSGVICVLGADNTGASFTGVERQERLVALAQKSAGYNNQDIRFVCADVVEAPPLLGHGTFTVAVMNPPYFRSGERSEHEERSLARHDAGDTLAVFLESAFSLLKNGGKLFLIYPADALAELMHALEQARFAPKRMKFVYTKAGEPALRVLIEAKKDGKPGLVIEPPLFAE